MFGNATKYQHTAAKRSSHSLVGTALQDSFVQNASPVSLMLFLRVLSSTCPRPITPLLLGPNDDHFCLSWYVIFGIRLVLRPERHT
jgi:hypothetical protein